MVGLDTVVEKKLSPERADPDRARARKGQGKRI